MTEEEKDMVSDPQQPVPAGFDKLPVLDLRAPNFIEESNRMLKELRAQGPLCRVEPLYFCIDCQTRDFR
jgi:hypothetical protein